MIMVETKRPLTTSERRDWLRLIRTGSVGPIVFRELLGRFGSAAAALDALPALARRGGRREPLRLPSEVAIDDELAAAERCGATMIATCEPAYPTPLAAISDAPPVIYVRGDISRLTAPTVAIVGARNASASAVRFTRQIASDLSEGGLVIVSGMARGIDTAAHQGALAGGTVAVLAGGVDVVYPKQNQALYDEIIESGAVVSEMPVGLEPTARYFVRRNRLISGLSLGIVVVEAAQRSGSLTTARHGLEQGREIFAVPGSPLDPRCKGTNGLIRQGAMLTETAEDVLDSLRPMLQGAFQEPVEAQPFINHVALEDEAELSPARARIAELLGPTPVEVDELIRQSELTPAIVMTILLELELAGRLDRHPGNRVSRR